MDMSNRARLRITGEDRARLLHAMTTNQVQTLKPGQGCYVFFLNAQGRILGDANLFCFADHFLLDTEPEMRTKLAEHLDRYIIADDVTVEDVTDSTAAIAIEGPQAAATLSALRELTVAQDQRDAGIPLEQSGLEQHGWVAWGARIVARVDTTGSSGFLIFTALADKSSLLAQLAQIPEAHADDARIVRIEHGRPRYGEEITDRYLVQETGQLRAVNFNKGCYLGQEIVERIRSRAQIHRVLCRLEIDTTEVPAPGAKLKGSEKAAEAAVAEIVSAAYSPALGKVVAMAYVRIPHNEPGTELLLGEVPARVSPSV
jgi:folate-binding protein YgfZ